MNEILTDKLPSNLKAENKATHDALALAVEKARRSGTPLVIKEKGTIKEIAATNLKRWFSARSL